jgi:hypothetical protein
MGEAVHSVKPMTTYKKAMRFHLAGGPVDRHCLPAARPNEGSSREES